DDLGAEEAHQLAPLDAEALRHDDDQRVALLGADHGEADAGVAAGRLDHRLARLQQTAALGVLDDTEGEAVLYRSHRVEGLEFGVEVAPLWRQLADAHRGRAADGLQDALISPCHADLSSVLAPAAAAGHGQGCGGARWQDARGSIMGRCREETTFQLK